ncbi:MAG: hypothetical protein ACXVPD_10035, partial [Bacteroidia bacterium]
SAATDWAGRIKSSTSAIALDTSSQSVTLANPIDSSNTGYHFNDTAEAVGIAAIAERRLDLINAHPNIAWLRDYGFVKLIKKELPNNESYLVMSNDSNFIFVYKILADSADGGFSCELYGSHSRDSSQVFYSYHAKDNEIYSFKKFK